MTFVATVFRNDETIIILMDKLVRAQRNVVRVNALMDILNCGSEKAHHLIDESRWADVPITTKVYVQDREVDVSFGLDSDGILKYWKIQEGETHCEWTHRKIGRGRYAEEVVQGPVFP